MKEYIELNDCARLGTLGSSEGMQYGLGLFETMIMRSGKIEDLSKHIQRLKHSAEVLKIAVPNDFEDLMLLNAFIKKQVLAMHDQGAVPNLIVVKMTLIKQGDLSNWFMTTRRYPYTQDDFESGFRISVSTVRRNSTSIIQRHKTLNYAENWLEKQKSIENGYQEVLFLNEMNEVTETSASNIFFLKGNQWFTPKCECGLLNGIMRQNVIAAMRQLGFIVEEGAYMLEDILLAEQVFLTNALMGIMPVKAIEHAEFLIDSTNHAKMIETINETRFLNEESR